MSKQPKQQSSFLDKVETKPEPKPELEEDLRPVEVKTIIEHWAYLKIIHNPHSLYCPDCKSKVILRPDGATVCPNCTTDITTEAQQSL